MTHSSDDDALAALAGRVGELLGERRLRLVAAESCTGGWVAQAVTSVPGSSAWFERGFVTYSNEAKQEMLGVGAAVLKRYGAVSEETAREMAEGALRNSHGGVSVAITGVAGPGGGTAAKPVGMVCIAWSGQGYATISRTMHFAGGRRDVRYQAVVTALNGVMDVIAG